jgi:hypothetical protein
LTKKRTLSNRSGSLAGWSGGRSSTVHGAFRSAGIRYFRFTPAAPLAHDCWCSLIDPSVSPCRVSNLTDLTQFRNRFGVILP